MRKRGSGEVPDPDGAARYDEPDPAGRRHVLPKRVLMAPISAGRALEDAIRVMTQGGAYSMRKETEMRSSTWLQFKSATLSAM